MSAMSHARMPQNTLDRISKSKFLRKYLGRPYVGANIWIWNHLPTSLSSWRLLRAHGVHLQRLIQLRAARSQSVGTYFFRNRPELEQLIRLVDRASTPRPLEMAILGCSKGTEVYSISYAIRSARGDSGIRIHAADISKEILDFAEAGIYALDSGSDPVSSSVNPAQTSRTAVGGVATNTSKDQPSSIFERMSPDEIEAMFDREGALLRVKPRYQQGISWLLGDAGDPSLVKTLGPQDIVMANRFLCHMRPEEAEKCLRNLAGLVKPGGYLFVSGVDLDVRTKVARELGWTPVTELISEIHEGDPSLRHDWPLRYWGLEPFDESRPDWKIRYASVFRCGETAPS